MWLKGDLHSHSRYSDGDSSVKDVLEEAKNRAGLQFASITDHDTHFRDHPSRITTWYDPAHLSSSGLTVLNGIEWTTSAGHANIWSTHPYDYSAIWTANRNKDPAATISLAHDQGALVSYNHPGSSNPWTLPTSRDVDCVEIWNGPDDLSSNFKATFKIWDGLLKQHGARVSAVGSIDMHDLDGALSNVFEFGKPRLWLLADDADPASVLAAIKHGRSTISESGSAPRLDVAVDRDANGSYETRLGDIIPLSANATMKFKMTLDAGGTSRPVEAVAQSDIDDINARLANGSNYSSILERICDEPKSDEYLLALIRNGRFFKAWLVDQASQDVTVNVAVDAASRSYYRAELYDNDERLAVTNPIYVNFTNVAHGTAGDDTLRGEPANDALYGGRGNDLVEGLGGRDSLYGEDGMDALVGGAAADVLAGGGGEDRYDFDYVADSGPGAARDLINDFAGAGAATSDQIDLGSLDANTAVAGNQAFGFIGNGPFTAPGQVRVQASGTDSLIQANVTGTSGAEIEILAKGIGSGQWIAGDFIL